jgi:DNA polymerase III subunit delta
VPLLREQELSAHLRKTLGGFYMLHGNAPLLLQEALQAIVEAARLQGFETRERFYVGARFDWSELLGASSGLSLFASRKIMDVRLPSSKPGKDGAQALIRLSTQKDPDTLVILSLGEVDWKTRKAGWFSGLSEAGFVLELNNPPREQLEAWVAGRLARQGQSASPSTLTFIADHVEGHLLAAHQEILKLGLLCPQGPLDPAQVEAAVLDVARYSLQDLRIPLLEGDFSRLARLLSGLQAEGCAQPLLTWWLANEIRLLARILEAEAQGVSRALVLKNERIFDRARQAQTGKALGRISLRHLYEALRELALLDRISKGVAIGDFWTLCLELCRRLCRPLP